MIQPLKIVHFGKYYAPERGGIESVTEALAVDQANAGHDVTVLCFTRGISSNEHYERLKIVRKSALVKVASQSISLSYFLEAVRVDRNIDIVHVHTPNLIAGLATLFLPRTTKVLIHWHADIANKGLLGLLTRPIEKLMLRRSDAIVCTSQAYAVSSPLLARHRRKVEVIPIGIADLSPEEESLAAAAAEGSAEPSFCLFVGRLVPYKGLQVLIRAAAAVTTDVRFVIVGDGPEKSALEELASELGVAQRVDFRGKIDHEALIKLFSQADLFCLSSINRLEAFGVVMLEAMRASRPVISADIVGSGVSWVNRTGIKVPVGDHEAFAQAIDEMMASPEYRIRAGKAARAHFLSEFTRERMSKLFLDLYRRLTQSGASHESPRHG